MPIWRAAEASNPHVVKELLMALAPEQLSYQNQVIVFLKMYHSHRVVFLIILRSIKLFCSRKMETL